MSEWWSYRLSDFLLFAPQTYYRQFELYNAAIWPAQVVAILLGIALLVLLRLLRPWQGRTIAAILAIFWLWIAWAFFHTRYAEINWAAFYFAVGFVAQALLLLWLGVLRNRLSFKQRRRRNAWAGFCILLLAVIAQPILGLLAGRSWSQAEIFALAPDPTVTGTLGILLAADRMQLSLILVPLLWCVISGATAWAMNAADAWLMPAVAILTLALALWEWRIRTSAPAPAWPHPGRRDRY